MQRNAGAAAVPAPVARSLANAAPRVLYVATAPWQLAGLAWGLRRACLEARVRIYENTPARALADAGALGRGCR
jgi:hypothetical protein